MSLHLGHLTHVHVVKWILQSLEKEQMELSGMILGAIWLLLWDGPGGRPQDTCQLAVLMRRSQGQLQNTCQTPVQKQVCGEWPEAASNSRKFAPQRSLPFGETFCLVHVLWTAETACSVLWGWSIQMSRSSISRADVSGRSSSAGFVCCLTAPIVWQSTKHTLNSKTVFEFLKQVYFWMNKKRMMLRGGDDMN